MSGEPLHVGINGVALLSPLTGIGQYTKNLAEALVASGEVRLSIFYRFAWSSEIRTEPPVWNLTKLKALIKRVVPHPYIVSRALEQRKFDQGVQERDIALYHEPNFLLHDFSGPAVITAHDLSWIRFPETHPPERVKIMNRLFPASLARANHVITDASYTRQEIIEQFGVAPDRITSIPLAARDVFRRRTEEECRPFLEARNLSYRSFILCVGTMEPRKNLALTVRTYAGMEPSFREYRPLVLVGMKGWLTTPIERVMQPLVASGQIRPLGFASDEDLAILYSSAAVLVYPSLYEGFGLPPLEAMTSGTPVIVSNRSTLPEVVGDAGILIHPEDEISLRNALHRLTEDAKFWEERRNAALIQAGRFSWTRCARETLAVYRRVLAST